MNTEWFSFGWIHEVLIVVLLGVYVLLVYWNKLPTMASFKEFVDSINTGGGHLLMLFLLTVWFFIAAMRVFFHILALPEETITKNNAVVMMGLTFVTGTAFGGAFSALLKTMSGGKATDLPPETTKQVTTTTERQAPPTP
jgi:hypothetical protein